MIYRYFASYAYIGNSVGPGWGFGNICGERDAPIQGHEDLQEVRDQIESVDPWPRNVCILNFALLKAGAAPSDHPQEVAG